MVDKMAGLKGSWMAEYLVEHWADKMVALSVLQ